MSDIEQFIRDLNETWLKQQYDALGDFFHPDVVMLTPGSADSILGADAMVESYREFGSMATVHAFNVDSITLFEFNSSTFCHMGFSVDYEIPEGRFQESGLDVYAVDTSGSSPKIVWRTQSRFD